MATILPILHFNDVYRVTKQRVVDSDESIDVTQFATLLHSIRDAWPWNEKESAREGLVLFSGDVFSPSVESTITRGSHMVPVMNELHPDVALTGNHDFDFGYPQLCKNVQASIYPWILSNIIDKRIGQTPDHLLPFAVLERVGIRIGVVGLVEKDWIPAIPSWPPYFLYQDAHEVGMDLSSRLRDPEGKYKCDLIIALTHSRLSNDILLAKALFAHKDPSINIFETHGVDLVLGGHDHLYYIGNGIDTWNGHPIGEAVLGITRDDGVRVIKSGTDFRDLSEIHLEIVASPPGSIRRQVIRSIQGARHRVTALLAPCPKMTEIVKDVLSSVSETLKRPVCITRSQWDVRSGHIRTEESAIGNWIADVIHHSYDDVLAAMGLDPADGALTSGGTLRGDSIYPPGQIILNDIMEILPWSNPAIVVELDGACLWDALESGLSLWPAHEGRFPIISDFRVKWDSAKPPGQRICQIWLHNEHKTTTNPTISCEVGSSGLPILREKGGQKYKVVMLEYMASGHDGYDILRTNSRRLTEEEGGMALSQIICKHLLEENPQGSQIKEILKVVNPIIDGRMCNIALDHAT